MQRRIDADHAVFCSCVSDNHHKCVYFKAVGRFDSRLICKFEKFYGFFLINFFIFYFLCLRVSQINCSFNKCYLKLFLLYDAAFHYFYLINFILTCSKLLVLIIFLFFNYILLFGLLVGAMQVLLQQNQKTSVHAVMMWLGGILYVV